MDEHYSWERSHRQRGFDILAILDETSYQPDAYGNGRFEPVGRVVRLEDTNADGQMDRSEVFPDKLVYPRARSAEPWNSHRRTTRAVVV